MKYNKKNKDKSKKLESGGKTIDPGEIAKKARATNQERVTKSAILAANPNSFKQAFAEARKAGLKEFTWNNKSYTTELKKETPTPTSNKTYEGRVLPEVVVVAKAPTKPSTPNVVVSAIDKKPNSTKVNTNQNLKGTNTKTSEEVSKVATPQTNSQLLTAPTAPTAPRSTAASATQSSSNWWERFNENNAKRRERALNRPSRGVPEVLQRIGHVTNKLSMRYQQGGQLPAYQQGGVIDNIKNWVSSLLVDPNKYQVNESTYTTYKERTPFIGFPKEVRSIVGPNGQTSTMVIRRPNTSSADTTFIPPGYAKDPDLYPTFTPQDIREGNINGRGNGSYLEKFIGKHQQGGTVDKKESNSTDQLYVDFAIRYLKAKGISEDNMVDNEGGLKDEFLEEVSTAINEVDSPDFWEQYKSNPDATVQSYVESKMEPEQIEMARKGAKLKKLKKGGMKSKKCKCGCDLIMKKEAGGTFVEVCACGCKNK